MNASRRSFLRQSTAVTAGFLGLDRFLSAAEGGIEPRGALVPDPHKILDLPEGFSYRVLSRAGDKMSDGFLTPGQPDGMAAFPGPDGSVVLVRNHELNQVGSSGFGPFKDNSKLPADFDPSLCYNPGDGKKVKPHVGGTSNLVFDPASGGLKADFLSLLGTDRNCAGGPTPWGSWITCEEPSDTISEDQLIHGYCFEVPATVTPGLTKPVPLKAMGRFRHEAVAVHPASGAVYLTEDRGDGMIYRFLPDQPGNLAAGGRLQALKVRDRGSVDTRNWPGSEEFPRRERLAVEWMDLEDVEAPHDDLRQRGVTAGAALFSRGEGMWYGSAGQVGEETIYWCCTDGGKNQKGQVFRYFPSPLEGQPGEKDQPGHFDLYLEPNDTDLLRNGDNLTVAPWGDLVICEDTSGINQLRGVTTDGRIYTIGRNRLSETEFAGACFSPDGAWLFVNIMSPGTTLAITGPWRERRVG